MNRTEYKQVYRIARITLRAMANTAPSNQAEQKAAEARWLQAVKGPERPVFYLLAGTDGNGSLATRALYAYRHGWYSNPARPWVGWVREALARKDI